MRKECGAGVSPAICRFFKIAGKMPAPHYFEITSERWIFDHDHDYDYKEINEC